jgi:AraC-like DNA-binding protein
MKEKIKPILVEWEFFFMGYFDSRESRGKITPFIIPEGKEFIELITGGLALVETGNGIEKYGAGTIFWHEAGEHTLYLIDKNEPYKCITFCFDAETRARNSIGRISSWGGSVAEALWFGEEMLRVYHDNEDRVLLRNYVVSRILWEALRHRLSLTRADIPLPLLKAISYIESNFSSDMTVKDMAAAADISKTHLFFLFRKYFKTTPHEIILSKRLSKSQLLLVKSENSIKSISSECGFLNSETFYRVFRRKCGGTPLEYRRKNRDLRLNPRHAFSPTV